LNKTQQKKKEFKFFYKSLPYISFLKIYKDPSQPQPKEQHNVIKLLIRSTSIDKQRKNIKIN
jgi:hypothetical protein